MEWAAKKINSSATTSFFSVHLSQPCFIAPALFTSPWVPSLSCTIPMVEREGIKDSGSSQRRLLINASASFNLPLNNAAAVSVCARTRVCLCAWMRVLHMHVESVIRHLVNADNRWHVGTRRQAIQVEKTPVATGSPSSPTGRKSFADATSVDVFLALEETFDSWHTHKEKRSLLCAPGEQPSAGGQL